MSSFLNLRQEFSLNLNTVIGNNDGMTVLKGIVLYTIFQIALVM